MTRAIVSICALFEFKGVEVEDIKKALNRAIEAQDGLKYFNIKINDEALKYFATTCGGYVCSDLNGLVLSEITTNINSNGETIITKEVAVECVCKKNLSLDEDVFTTYFLSFVKALVGVTPLWHFTMPD